MLPKIETPRHGLTLPISGKDISFRPFLVKEQKVLLQAMEMGDKGQLDKAINDITTACTFGEIDVSKLALADTEFLVLWLRAKSIGEQVDILANCPECKAKTPISINITDVEVTNLDKDPNIQLYEDVGIVMKDIAFGEVQAASAIPIRIDSEFAVVLASIDKVYDKDQVYSRTDFSDEELTEFIETLPTAAYKKIEEYVGAPPELKKDVHCKCHKCDHEFDFTIKGLSNFFG